MKFIIFSKVIEYNFSTVSVCFNTCVGPFQRIEITLSLLSICGDELTSTPKIITFLPVSLPSEKTPFLSNTMPYPEYLH